MKINLNFFVSKAKLITQIGLKVYDKSGAEKKQVDLYDAVFDSGCEMTTISDLLFDDLGYSYKDEADITIISVNNESKGKSSIIDYFELGGVNIGPVRVAVGKIHENHKDRIILGMNVLLWHHVIVNYHKKQISLIEREFRNLDLSLRYTVKDITAVNLAGELLSPDII
jgi:hypothetical protein